MQLVKIKNWIELNLFITTCSYLISKWLCLSIGAGGSSVSVLLQTGRPGLDPRQGQRIFPLASVFRPALNPTQPPIQWVPGVLSPGVKRGRGMTLTTLHHLLPRSGMSRSCSLSPAWRDSFTFLFYAETYLKVTFLWVGSIYFITFPLFNFIIICLLLFWSK
jgi:hypothetical protein